jgi:hypothetical protein
VLPSVSAPIVESLDSKENLHHLARAFAHKANNALVNRMVHEHRATLAATAEDKIQHLDQAKTYTEEAKKLLEEAQKLEGQHKEQQTRFERMKPTMTKALIGIVVAAEVISIPVLLMSSYVMCKHHTTDVPVY